MVWSLVACHHIKKYVLIVRVYIIGWHTNGLVNNNMPLMENIVLAECLLYLGQFNTGLFNGKTCMVMITTILSTVT